MKLTHIPFGSYRMFGNPIQMRVYTQEQLAERIDENNGVRDCYLSISCYDSNGHPHPLFFPIDLDGSGAKEDAKKILTYLQDYDLNYYFIFSGAKGYHFQIPVIGTPTKFDFMNFANLIRKELRLKTMDMRVSQDLKRLMRIPNTMNMKSGKLCEIIDIYDSGIHLFLPYFSQWNSREELQNIKLEFDTPVRSDLLHPFPCLEKLIHLKEPPHIIRVAFVIYRSKQGRRPDEIFQELESMNWRDWNPRLTQYQIRHILRKNYGLSCGMLKEYCLKEECPYHVSNWSRTLEKNRIF